MTLRRGLLLSLVERYILLLLALTSNIVLARLLTPEQIGIYSVSLAVIGVAQVLRDFGVGNYLIQEKHLTPEHVQTAFGVSLLIGVALFAIVAMATPWACRFYGEPRMESTLRISALNFLLLPFCTISLSLLRRNLLFKRILYVSIAAGFAGFVVTILLAINGFGPDSMAVGSVVSNMATGFGAWFVRIDRQILLPSFKHWRPLANFGVQSSAASVVSTVAMDINDLALGKILGFEPVAILSRAQGLTNLLTRDVMSAVRSVVFPAFAQAHRDGEPLESRYIASVSNMTVLAWPFFGFLSLYSLEVLRTLYGPQWDAAARLVVIFSIAGAITTVTGLVNSVILAVGRMDLIARVELLFQPARAGLIVVVALAFKSLEACAIAYLVAMAIHAPVAYFVKGRCIPNDWISLWRNLMHSFAVTIATLLAPMSMSVYYGLSRTDPVNGVVFAAAAFVALTCWIVAAITMRHPVSFDPLFKKLARLRR